MSSEERELSKEDPIIIDLLQRVSRLEARVDGVEKVMNILKEKVEQLEEVVKSVDSKTWYIVAGIAISILMEILIAVLK
jgi:archaellum component FlaC